MGFLIENLQIILKFQSFLNEYFFTSFWCKFEVNLLGLVIYSKFLIGDLGLSINEDWLSV